MVEPVTVMAAVSGLIELGNKLMDKFPDYKQKVEKDFNKCQKQFGSYKLLPREKRVSSYLFKLKAEIEGHLITAKEYIL